MILGTLLSLALTPVGVCAQTSICYAAPWGNDLNDGFSSRSAKADVMGCYDSLPSEGGIIYVQNNTPATPVPGQGLWIMGSTDPNYSRPPVGWRRAKTGVDIIGLGGGAGFGGYAAMVAIAAGSNTDRNHPAIWLSGTAAGLHFANLSIEYPGRGIVIGENSSHVRTGDGGGGSQNITFDNVAVHLSGRGNGPAVDLTGGSFWVKFLHCTFHANPQAVSSTDDTGAAVLLDGKSGGGASADFEDTFVEGNTNGGGSIKFYPVPYTINSLYIHGLQTEALQGVPAVWLLPSVAGGSATSQASITISDVTLADSMGTTPAVQVDGVNNPAENVVVTGVQDALVAGAATVFSQSPPNLYSILVPSPLRSGQRGIFEGRVVGQMDAARRGFSPVAARFPNLASQLVSKWKTPYSGNLSLTSVVGPDGTRNAGRVASTTGQSSAQFYVRENYQQRVGDWIVAGVWTRAVTGHGYFNGVAAVQVSLQYATVSGGAGNGGYAVLQAPWKGDGEWEWVWGAWKVLKSTRPGTMLLSGMVDENTATDFFAPVLLDIPAGAISDNEAWEIALNLQSYRDDAVPGQVSLLRGEQFKADSIQIGDGPTMTSGVGIPQGSAGTGSIYLRRDGTAGSTLYVFESGSWKAQF
jgi:hypothetical protein